MRAPDAHQLAGQSLGIGAPSTPAMSSGSGELSPYDRYRVLTTAQAMWAERERGFPKFTRQKWDDGTPLARAVALWAAAIKLGLIEEAA